MAQLQPLFNSPRSCSAAQGFRLPTASRGPKPPTAGRASPSAPGFLVVSAAGGFRAESSALRPRSGIWLQTSQWGPAQTRLRPWVVVFLEARLQSEMRVFVKDLLDGVNPQSWSLLSCSERGVAMFGGRL